MICIVCYILYYMHCSVCIVFNVFYSMICIIYIVFYALYTMHSILFENLFCFLKLIADRPSDLQTDRTTDIVVYRETIAAKKKGTLSRVILKVYSHDLRKPAVCRTSVLFSEIYWCCFSLV